MSFAHTLCDLEFDAVRYGDFFIYSHWSHELYVWYRGHHGWSKLSIITDTTQPSNCHMEGKLVKCGEHVLLVTSTIHNEEKGFNIWKLTLDNDRLIFKWERVSTTSANLMWKSFGYLHPTYIVNDSNICIMLSSARAFTQFLDEPHGDNKDSCFRGSCPRGTDALRTFLQIRSALRTTGLRTFLHRGLHRHLGLLWGM
ncbi:hypothetical protein L7F22_035546 [Adiantum nelumboides]|nr:hypothetical protein [Adiantum nelumboides]